METSLKNPKRVFPFHGQTRIPRRVGLTPGDRTRDYSTRFKIEPEQITVPCVIGYERPYGDRWLRVDGFEAREPTDRSQATVFTLQSQVANLLMGMANDRPAPWSLFFEPVEVKS